MTIWHEIALSALGIAITCGMIRLIQHWSFSEAKARDAEAWSYLKWDDRELIKLHKKCVDLVSNGQAKPSHLRSLEAIKQALAARKNLTSKRIFHHAFTHIDIRPNGTAFDVFYVVDESELASGRETHIGCLRQFTSNTWVLRPTSESSLAWALDESSLSELLNKVVALNAGP